MIIKEGSLNEVLKLQHTIPEFDDFYSKEKYVFRLKNNIYKLILVAYENDIPIGFKAGYALDDLIFYSWMGGVLPEHR